VLHLVSAQPEALLHELNERNVDFLIAHRFGSVADERLGFELLFEDSYVVAAGVQSPWARRRKVELAELVNESWVLPPPDSVIGSIAKEAFRAKALSYPRTSVVTVPPDVRLTLLATGRFLAIFPASSFRFSTRRSGIKILPVELPIAPVPVGIVTLKKRTLSPLAQLFIEHAREVAKPRAPRENGRRHDRLWPA
jgi:DNA-binding transcriptional LysR family regulator